MSMVPGWKCQQSTELGLVQKLHDHFLMDRVVRACFSMHCSLCIPVSAVTFRHEYLMLHTCGVC